MDNRTKLSILSRFQRGDFEAIQADMQHLENQRQEIIAQIEQVQENRNEKSIHRLIELLQPTQEMLLFYVQVLEMSPFERDKLMIELMKG